VLYLDLTDADVVDPGGKRQSEAEMEMKMIRYLTEIFIDFVELEKKKTELKCLEAAKGKVKK
jgi:hypothetical protein